MKHELGLLIPQFAEKIVAPKMTGVDDFLVLVFNRKTGVCLCHFWISNIIGNPFSTSIIGLSS